MSSRNLHKTSLGAWFLLLVVSTAVGMLINMSISTNLVLGQTQTPATAIRDIRKIEEIDILDDTRIEKEVMSGGYVCFKAYRRDSKIELDSSRLEKLNLQSKDITFQFTTVHFFLC